MRAPTNHEVLGVWERGQGMHPLDRGLLALGVASPDVEWERLAEMPLGRRNRSLVDLRTACFGPQLAGWLPCPGCEDKLEFELDASIFSGVETAGVGLTIEAAGRTYRLPDSRSLAAAAREGDPETAVTRLLESCITRGGAGWTEDEIREIGEKMASADPLARPTLSLECAGCGTKWDEPLDLVAFFWAEVEAKARRLLMEVHRLASAYGWSEAQILGLSEQRRALYLEMVWA
jgi:hypothetical protein